MHFLTSETSEQEGDGAGGVVESPRTEFAVVVAAFPLSKQHLDGWKSGGV